MRGLLLLGQGEFVEGDDGSGFGAQLSGGELANFLQLRALDAHEGGIAQLVAAGLDGEDSGGGQLGLLEPTFFKLSFDVKARFGLFDVQDQGGVGQVEQFGEDDAGLAQAQVFRLQTGEDEVGRLGLDSGGEQAGDAQRIECVEVIATDVDAAVGALGEGLADGWSDPLGSGGEDDDFAAVLFLELKGFFQGVGVGFVEGELEVGLLNPLAGRVDADRRIAVGNLFDGNDDFHGFSTSIILTRGRSYARADRNGEKCASFRIT